jgi:glutathione S-transferase
MFESIAIMQYILNLYAEGRLEPDRKGPTYGQCLQWLHFGEATLMGQIALVGAHTFLLPENERNPAEVKRAIDTLTHYSEILDEELADKAYLAGDEFTAADISVGYALFLMKLFKIYPPGHANLDAYYERLAARRAFQTATSL